MNSKQVTVEDFIQIKNVSSPQISPDGGRCVYVLQTVDDNRNSYKSNIWITFPNGKIPSRQFTSGDKESLPKWSHDGKWLAFLSGRNDKNKSSEQKSGPQLFVIPVDGGEAIQITNFTHGVKNFDWHPSSLCFAILTSISEKETKELLNKDGESRPSYILYPNEAEAYDARKRSEKNLMSDPRHIKRMFYRQLNYYNEDRRDQLFLINLKENFVDYTFKPVLVTTTEHYYSPSKWMNNGEYLISTRPVGGDPSATFQTEIVKINIKDKSITKLGEIEGYGGDLLVSKDDQFVFLTGFGEKNEDVHRNSQLFSLPLDEPGKLKCFSRSLDGNFNQIMWLSDTKVLGITPESGTTIIYEIDISKTEDNVNKIISEDRNINQFHYVNDYIIFEVSTEFNPSELLSYHLSSKEEIMLTNINTNYLKSRLIAKSEVEIVESSNAGKIMSWLLLPGNHDGKSKLPVILEIHGGPAFMWAVHEKTMWQEFNTIVSQGYAVIFTNPRGSDGYGYKFRRDAYRNWGKIPAEDIMAGVDHFLNKYDFLDKERLGVTGGSYGGYMTAWLLGHYQNRFKAGVSQRGVYDLQSLALSTDIVAWMEGQYGDIWNNLDAYWDASPIASVENFKAPLLILHSDHDFRVPVTTSEQLFWACKRFNKTVELVKYPREGHELSRSGEPRHIIDRLSRIVDWFNKYVK
ncbi:MAG: Prolyl tripeptidyl peptidase precursor [Candidatus Heimdallarchaeota archaeon LC_3]|nr:MAG: Prolyl tripeptidyl peptidase precursor [Candidatus Heimdallarchaeota archaeon LC_3]